MSVSVSSFKLWRTHSLLFVLDTKKLVKNLLSIKCFFF